MLILAIFGIALWIYLLTVLTRAHLDFFKFLVGSVGLFFILMNFQSYVITYITQAVAIITGVAGDLTGIYEAYYKYSMLLITKGNISISMYIDYECSGIIEIIAFSAMLWFFPLYQTIEKLIVNIIGVAWILMANVIRIYAICLMVYWFGNDIYYFAHTIVGRIIFYILSIILYYVVFTKYQVIRQKVGNFSYEKNNK